jgi:hypothetical protein
VKSDATVGLIAIGQQVPIKQPGPVLAPQAVQAGLLQLLEADLSDGTGPRQGALSLQPAWRRSTSGHDFRSNALGESLRKAVSIFNDPPACSRSPDIDSALAFVLTSIFSAAVLSGAAHAEDKTAAPFHVRGSILTYAGSTFRVKTCEGETVDVSKRMGAFHSAGRAAREIC